MHVLGEWGVPLSFPVLPSTAPCLGHGVALTYFGGTWKGKGPSGCIRCLWACFISRRQMKGLSLSAKYGSGSCQVLPVRLAETPGREESQLIHLGPDRLGAW